MRAHTCSVRNGSSPTTSGPTTSLTTPSTGEPRPLAMARPTTPSAVATSTTT